MPEKLFFNGDIFGIVDNGILVAVTLMASTRTSKKVVRVLLVVCLELLLGMQLVTLLRL